MANNPVLSLTGGNTGGIAPKPGCCQEWGWRRVVRGGIPADFFDKGAGMGDISRCSAITKNSE
jgi:hypothetical protein